MSDQPCLCPVCDSERNSEIFRSANGYPIMRCAECNVAFTDARTAPPPDQLYPHFDQTNDSAALEKVRGALSVFLRQRGEVVRSAKTGGRLLDFGCGAGAFAKHMSHEGYDVVGLEPFSLGETTSRPGLQLIRKPLEQAAPELGQFDVITMWHVLEHLEHPAKTLQALSKHLGPKGVLIVSVPNFASWQSTLFQGAWFHLDPPRHLIHFEPQTLKDTLSRAGFTVQSERRFLPEYGSSGWVQSTLNRVLPHTNFLYELVKDRGALKNMGVASSALHLAGSMLAGVPLLALSVPLEAAASALHGEAAVTLIARGQ
ncbi:MAG: class I SAM-dependent methyltransferase [Myxococcaceae bacterium]